MKRKKKSKSKSTVADKHNKTKRIKKQNKIIRQIIKKIEKKYSKLIQVRIVQELDIQNEQIEDNE